ncbi:MAG TPA: MFS transporter [Rugosimonospora sp.]|nr:MFS transporter [Rugosimonospora sp.]
MEQTTIAPSPSGVLKERTRQGTATMVAVVVFNTVIYQFCATMPTVATPDIMTRLHTTGAMVGLTQGLFFLVSGVVAVTVMAYSDHARRRRLMLWCLGVTVAGLLLAVLASNIYLLMLARVLQAASGAGYPLALSIFRRHLSPRRFGRATGALTGLFGGIVGVDDLLAGSLTDRYGFRAIFVFIMVCAVIAIIGVARGVPETFGSVSGRMDWWGAALLCLGLVFIEMGLGAVKDAPVVAVVVAAVGLLTLAVFTLMERRRENPLVPVAVLRSRQMWPLLMTTVLIMMSYVSVTTFTIPVLAQNPTVGFGYSARTAALLFIMPACAATILAAPLMGRLAPRLGWRRMLRLGVACMVPLQITLALNVQARWLVMAMVPVLAIFAAGMALTAVNGLSVILSEKHHPGLLAGVNTVCYGIGGSVGITVASLIATSGGQLTSRAISNSLWTSALFGVVTLAVSFAVGGASVRGSQERV